MKSKNVGFGLDRTEKGITLVALVITIVLNRSYLAMERMLKNEKILKI